MTIQGLMMLLLLIVGLLGVSLYLLVLMGIQDYRDRARRKADARQKPR